MKARDYQDWALDALFAYFAEKTGNPIIAMPTGTGKSFLIADFLRRALTLYPGTRALMVTHVKELIEQNMKNLLAAWPTAPVGIYSAGLRRRDTHAPITFAGIASVYKKAHLFGRIDLLLIDECHLVGTNAMTTYRKFIAALMEINPNLKVIGLSATAYRLGQGMLTDPGGIFTDVCVDLTSRDNFNMLIAQGWLSRLVPKKTSTTLDVGEVRVQGGEYVQTELQLAVDKEPLTHAALKEAVYLAHDRRFWLVFASGLEHAEHIAGALTDMDIPAAVVHGELSSEERASRIAAHRSGKIRALVNYNVLTTGYDFPEIDCILMLRPTASPGLWVQMLGRGTRPVYAEGYPLDTAEQRLAAIAAGPKPTCLVLDFAGNTVRLGPVNDPVLPRHKNKGKAQGMAPVRLCEHCMTFNHISARFCVECGAEFPRITKLYSQASTAELVAGVIPPIETHTVQRVVYNFHKKEGRPDMMRVYYYCGLLRFEEYICLDHTGYAGKIARQWWEMRVPDSWRAYPGHGVPPSVAAGMEAINQLRVPTEIRVAMKKRYPEICGYTFADGMDSTSLLERQIADTLERVKRDNLKQLSRDMFDE